MFPPPFIYRHYTRGYGAFQLKSLLSQWKSCDMMIMLCGYGGIGRRAGFRFLCRKACGFDPHYPYQTRIIRTNSPLWETRSDYLLLLQKLRKIWGRFLPGHMPFALRRSCHIFKKYIMEAKIIKASMINKCKAERAVQSTARSLCISSSKTGDISPGHGDGPAPASQRRGPPCRSCQTTGRPYPARPRAASRCG